MRLLSDILLTGVAALMLTACSAVVDGDYAATDESSNINNSYINLAIAVTNGTDPSTRANEPKGGEDGDGREYGFDRENAITGITLILYQDAMGINTSDNPAIDFVAYYPVSRTTTDADTRIEATYETGNQLVPHNTIDFTKTYHAVVVANANLTGTITTSKHLNDVRSLTLSDIYSGSATSPAYNCVGFVMSSEQDNTLNFAATGVKTQDAAGDYYYDLSTQTLVIERMAARIDFWAKNSNGYKTSSDNPAYTTPGYEYTVIGGTDRFVVTGIVPFNLVNGHTDYGKEYLIKQLRTDIAEVSTTSYLTSEDTAPYVMDPKTNDKTGTEALTNSLENVYTLIGEGKLENTTDNPYYHSIASMRNAGSKSDIETHENVVVAYPMENTLSTESYLYYYATGIAIIGYYYAGGTGTGTRLVYLGYLRHQGDSETYNVSPYTTPLGTSEKLGTTTPMNFGVVRNNIYRVCINSIDKKGSLELAIKVKKWDSFTHDFIYM